MQRRIQAGNTLDQVSRYSSLCHRPSSGGATTNTSFVMKRQVTPGGSAEAGNFSSVFLGKKETNKEKKTGSHRIALKIGRISDKCLISKAVPHIFFVYFQFVKYSRFFLMTSDKIISRYFEFAKKRGGIWKIWDSLVGWRVRTVLKPINS